MADAAAAGFYQAALGQNAQVPGNGRAADWKARRQVVDGERRVPKLPQDLAADRVAESIESVHSYRNRHVTILFVVGRRVESAPAGSSSHSTSNQACGQVLGDQYRRWGTESM